MLTAPKGLLLFVFAAFVTVAVAAILMYAYAPDRPPQRQRTEGELIYEACWREFGHDAETDDAVLRRVHECIQLATDKAKMDRVLNSVSAPK
jgi:hypothetical protein